MLVCQAMENSVDTVMILYNFIGPGLGDRALMYLDVMGLMEYTGTTNGQYEPWHEQPAKPQISLRRRAV